MDIFKLFFCRFARVTEAIEAYKTRVAVHYEYISLIYD